MNDPDENRDGVLDGEQDSDGDGLSDYLEVGHLFTNPHSTDSDGDTLQDDEELFVRGTNPLDAADDGGTTGGADTDGDGVPDGAEVANGTGPTDPSSF